MESCISVLDRRFKSGSPEARKSGSKGKRKGRLLLSLSFVLLCCCASALPGFRSSFCSAEMIDRVVASVDNQAITLSEFQQVFKEMTEDRALSRTEVLEAMINRLLLLREAKEMRFEGASDDEIIREYLEIKIRSLIFIREEEIQQFYAGNEDKWGGQDYLVVRDGIETYLFEKEFNERLKKHLEKLKDKAEIHSMLEGNNQ